MEADQFDSDPEVIAARQQVEEAQRVADENAAALAAEQEEMRRNNAERERLLQLLAQHDANTEARRAAILEKRREANRARLAVEAAERAYRVAQDNAETRKKLAEARVKYEEIARDMPWYTGLEDGSRILPHQWDGAQFLASASRAILGDKMGLGKTLTAVAALDLVDSTRALVIAPSDITSNFHREIKRWAPHRAVVNLRGMTKAERQMTLKMAAMLKPLVVVINYEAWRKDNSLLDTLVEMQFDTVIADEAHTIKGTSTNAFKGVKRIVFGENTCPLDGTLLDDATCPECRWTNTGMSHFEFPNVNPLERMLMPMSVKNLWLMTGTPILNSPDDLFSMLHLMDPINFERLGDYLRTYCDLSPYTGRYSFRAGGLDRLTNRISGRYLARKPGDAGIVYPPQDVIVHELEFEEGTYIDQQRVIKQLTDYAQIVLNDGSTLDAFSILALLTRKRQANVAPGGIVIKETVRDIFGEKVKDPLTGKYMENILFSTAEEIKESIKADKAMSLIMEHGIVDGNRIVVFSQFKTALADMEERLAKAGISAVRFDGDTPDELKDQIKTNFDKSLGEKPKWQVLLANYRTGGTGLNLTACTHTIVMDEEWNPGKRDQSYGRTQRIGQDEETFVHILRINKTVDTWMADLLTQKEQMVEGFENSTADLQNALSEAMRSGEML